MAKGLLKSLNIAFEEVDITDKPEIMEALVQKTRRMTVPQIFADDVCLGGYDSIAMLHERGELVEMCRE